MITWVNEIIHNNVRDYNKMNGEFDGGALDDDYVDVDGMASVSQALSSSPKNGVLLLELWTCSGGGVAAALRRSGYGGGWLEARASPN